MSKLTFFEKIRNSRAQRIICAFLALNLMIEIVSPAAAMALTSGPSQPEFSSFEPVATTDMVNDFTGDFTYNLPVLNVPGPDGGGYSMSLSYHSGVSSEEEASWVGFGWTLNPGAINRNKRGYADEFNGVSVEHFNKVKPNWTQIAGFNFGLEISSVNKKDNVGSNDVDGGKAQKKLGDKTGSQAGGSAADEASSDSQGDADTTFVTNVASVSLHHSIRYNNYTGFSISNSLSGDIKQLTSLSLNRSGVQNTLGFTVNPILILKKVFAEQLKKITDEKEKTTTGTSGFKAFLIMAAKKTLKYVIKQLSSRYSIRSYNVAALPYSVGKTASAAWNFSTSFKYHKSTLPVGTQYGISGHMNVTVNESYENLTAYGYMNSHQGNAGDALNNKVFDYQVEKETTFNKHDKNLGIPFNTADIFSASGNGVIGGFKMVHDKIGSFFPSSSTSDTKIRQLGIEGGLGACLGIGMNLGSGKKTTTVKGLWPDVSAYDATKKFSGNKPIMRFTNDPGGEINYGDNYDDKLYAAILRDKTLDLGPNFNLSLNQARSKGSSYIEYDQDQNETNPCIKGIKITNKDGGKSNYTKPVYTKNETELSVGIDTFQDGNYLVTQQLHYDSPLQNKTVVGRKVQAPYAASYLLESNTTFNYIDADSITGPSEGDFGGWTKFDYKQAWGGSGEWYRYRSPYAGLQYNKGRLLDPNDQTGGMSCGDKELYYLKCIETKSHIAFFITNKTKTSEFTTDYPAGKYKFLYNASGISIPAATLANHLNGSGATRFDGIDAAKINGGMDEAAENLNKKGEHEVQKLERIVLFAKSDLSKPLTTTYFEYNYSLCRGIPNYKAAAGSTTRDGGKLTLKKVWTESNGIARSQIAPYQFHYEYFNKYPESVYLKYDWAKTEFNDKYVENDANQNPVYSPSQLDAWGFYQEQGDKRFKNMQPWLSQQLPGDDAFNNTFNPGNSANFDPAAWQLKRIQLPSGGEIHVNYEQKDYSYVEKNDATAMVSLRPDENKDGYKSDESMFCINTDDIESSVDLYAYASKLRSHFLVQNNKLYFKFLYSFIGEDEPKLNTENRQYEYVSGYTTVNDVSVAGTPAKIFLKLGDIKHDGKKDKTLPRFVCYQELETNGGHNLGPNAMAYKNDDYTEELYQHDPVDVSDAQALTRGHIFKNTIAMFEDWVSLRVKNVAKKKACQKLNFNLSYFKLPVHKAKKGGGIRVKRLLMYDPGIGGDTGDAMIYGSEYIYKQADGTSSGVALNEPVAIREENALVEFLERKKQRFFDRITNGRDTKQFEGPLGENLLPGPGVVHSRIITQNIHSQKSATGYAVTIYHTAHEYPMQMDDTPLSKTDRTYRKKHFTIPLGLFNLEVNKDYVTQGYIFWLNDMNGKISSKTMFPGSYTAAGFNANGFTSQTTYNYSVPGQKVATLLYDKDRNEFVKEFLNQGMEEDFTIFSANVHEKTNDFFIEIDWNLAATPPSPYPTIGPSYSFTDNMLCQQVVSKVVSRTSYLLSTTNTTDGVTQTTKNLAFDRYTNDPVLTQTFDGYGDPTHPIKTMQGSTVKDHQGYYYSFNIPGSWMYPSMGPKADNDTNTNQLGTMVGNVITYSVNAMWSKLNETSDAVTKWSPVTNPLTNVISASATTYRNNWFGNESKADYPALNNAAVYAKANAYYYPLATYAYLDSVKNANATGGRINEAGMTNNAFKFFNWTSAANTADIAPQWYADGAITRYSPYGYPLEEKDALGIKSSARFGYGDLLPVLVAKNAGYGEVKFEDFEYGNQHPAVTKNFAHSGKSSLQLSTAKDYTFASGYNFTPEVMARGITVKLWLKSIQKEPMLLGLKNPQPKPKVNVDGIQFDLTAIAQTGEWTLYSTDITAFNGLLHGLHTLKLDYNYILSSPAEEVYVDDFRIQPLDASANCSVYYTDNKLAAQFDDQHFGVFYEYNHKGQLVRKSIETERGKKMLQEQQYNIPLINR